MRFRELPEVLAIEQASFPNPWTKEEFLDVFYRPDVLCDVAECEGQIVGFMLFKLHEGRFYILDFAVHPKYQRRRIGSQMLNVLQTNLARHRRKRIILQVAETNLEAQLFLSRCGFIATGIERGSYDDSDADAYRFEFWCPACGEGTL